MTTDLARFTTDSADLIVSSACSHDFHRDCLVLWLKTKSDCPCCRQSMWDQATYDLTRKEILERVKPKDADTTDNVHGQVTATTSQQEVEA